MFRQILSVFKASFKTFLQPAKFLDYRQPLCRLSPSSYCSPSRKSLGYCHLRQQPGGYLQSWKKLLKVNFTCIFTNSIGKSTRRDFNSRGLTFPITVRHAKRLTTGWCWLGFWPNVAGPLKWFSDTDDKNHQLIEFHTAFEKKIQEINNWSGNVIFFPRAPAG